MIYIIAFVILISVIVFVHELGHYLAARSIGVTVEQFSIGMPPTIYKYKPKNILLDNFSLLNTKKAIEIINRRITTIEVSGGINIKNISKYANLNIDYISIGDLTKNVSAIDFSMLVNK